MNSIRPYTSVIQPLSLITCALLYSLGAGIVDFQEQTVDSRAFVLGLSWIILIQLGMTFMNGYFQGYQKNGVNEVGEFSGDSTVRNATRWGILTSFTGTAVVGVLLIHYQLMSLTVFLLAIMMVLIVIFFSAPPFTLSRSGYGEFLFSFWSVLLIPAFGMTIQKGINFQILSIIVAPLFCLHLAMQLALELKSYKLFPINPPKNYFDHFGWKAGIYTHNACLIASLVFIGAGFFWGLPKFIFYIIIALLPIGFFQFIHMLKLLAGAKPLWNLISLAAYSLFYLSTYLISYAYWVQ
jgi:1,4-dihydroxy-2-naphthoate octaprenyltransferase